LKTSRGEQSRKRQNVLQSSREIKTPSAQWIRKNVYTPSIRLSNPYFWNRLKKRNIDIREIDEALQSCEIIEILKKHNPIRLLVNGYTFKRRPIHIVFSVWPFSIDNETSSYWLDVVTAYEPEPSRWITPTKRKGQS